MTITIIGVREKKNPKANVLGFSFILKHHNNLRN